MPNDRGKLSTTGQKVDIQPTSDANPSHVALDETVIRINGPQFWLKVAVGPRTNEPLCLRRFTGTVAALTKRFCKSFVRDTTSLTLCFSSITPSS